MFLNGPAPPRRCDSPRERARRVSGGRRRADWRREHGRLQRLHQVLPSRRLPRNSNTTRAAMPLVGLDFIRPVGLRTAIGGLREFSALPGRARKGGILARFRRERFPSAIVAHEARGREPCRLLLAAHP